jgi:alpha-D-xyloside xylohydrolase
MLRAMFLEYPEDPMVWHLDMQYFLGDSLLVAPVFNAEGSIQYYLPKGDWYGLLDGKIRTGGGYISEEHDFFSLPVLLRPGSAIARSVGERKESVVYDWSEDVELLVNWVEGMDKTVRIADHEQAGEFKVALRVQDGQDGVTVEVIEGKINGSVDIKVVNKDIVGDNIVQLKEDQTKVTFKLK